MRQTNTSQFDEVERQEAKLKLEKEKQEVKMEVALEVMNRLLDKEKPDVVRHELFASFLHGHHSYAADLAQNFDFDKTTAVQLFPHSHFRVHLEYACSLILRTGSGCVHQNDIQNLSFHDELK